jgi:hypothetical protein
VALAMALAVVVTLAGLGLSYYLTEQTGCAVGRTIVSNETVETPQFTVNAPYMGTAATNANIVTSPVYQFESGSLTVRSQPLVTLAGVWGSEAGVTAPGTFWPTGEGWMTGHWTIYSVHNATMQSFRPLHPCTAPFIAVESTPFTPPATNGPGLALPNNTTDANESTTPLWNIPASSGFQSAQLYTPYNTPNYPEVDTCGSAGTTLAFGGWTEVPIGIPFTYDGQNRTVMGELLWEGYSGSPFFSPTFTYGFPGYFGIWKIDSLAGNDTLGFLSFSYEPC